MRYASNAEVELVMESARSSVEFQSDSDLCEIAACIGQFGQYSRLDRREHLAHLAHLGDSIRDNETLGVGASSRAAAVRGLPDVGTLPGLDDEEGERLPTSLPHVIDAHIHLFPDPLFEAIWRWFEAHGWPIRYKLTTPRIIEFLLAKGLSSVVALHYAHKPGIARALNAYMAEVCRNEPRVIGLATVFPGEEGATAILEEAFDAGLRGVKLHCHVQCMSADADAMRAIYEVCARRGMPVVIHAGRQPASVHYKCDVMSICAAERIERVLQDHPTLKLCVPHLGADEYDDYERLLGRYDNLWLDTTMMVAEYFPLPSPMRLVRSRPERIMYGTDFPNLPYAWDREAKKLMGAGLDDGALEHVFGATAMSLFGIEALPAR